uniref:Uncharacterized protein n=1 Tax=Arundo donax TaxID=35708 RepID=A0A0A9B6K5_ARUDO
MDIAAYIIHLVPVALSRSGFFREFSLILDGLIDWNCRFAFLFSVTWRQVFHAR